VLLRKKPEFAYRVVLGRVHEESEVGASFGITTLCLESCSRLTSFSAFCGASVQDELVK
jgi:hypothetical protein